MHNIITLGNYLHEWYKTVYCFFKIYRITSWHFSLKIHKVTFHIWPKFGIFQFYQMVKIFNFFIKFWRTYDTSIKMFCKMAKNPQNQTEYSLSFHLWAILPLLNANVLLPLCPPRSDLSTILSQHIQSKTHLKAMEMVRHVGTPIISGFPVRLDG